MLAAKQRSAAAEDRRKLDKLRAQPRPLGRSVVAPSPLRRPRDMHASTASSFVSSRRMPMEMDASRMTESPSSASTIMGESVMPDGSYMVVRDVDPRDPSAQIEAMLAQLSRPVAFASVPLPSKTARAAAPRPRIEASPSPQPDVVDSFLFVPEAPRRPAPSSKTVEELTLENASLKASLDSITAQLHAINSERDQLRHSIADLGRGLRGVTMASSPLAPPLPAQPAASRPEDLSRIAELEAELDVARASALKQKTRASISS